jgi:hypothetical protein
MIGKKKEHTIVERGTGLKTLGGELPPSQAELKINLFVDAHTHEGLQGMAWEKNRGLLPRSPTPSQVKAEVEVEVSVDVYIYGRPVGRSEQVDNKTPQLELTTIN